MKHYASALRQILVLTSLALSAPPVLAQVNIHSCADDLPVNPMLAGIDERETGTRAPMLNRGDLYRPRRMTMNWWNGEWTVAPQAQTNIPARYLGDGFGAEAAKFYSFDPSLWASPPNAGWPMQLIVHSFYDEFHTWSSSRPEYTKPSYHPDPNTESEIFLEGALGETVYGSFAVVATRELSGFSVDMFRGYPFRYPEDAPEEIIFASGANDSRCIKPLVNSYNYQRPYNGSRLVSKFHRPGEYATASQIRPRWVLPTSAVPPAFLSNIGAGQFRDLAFAVRIPKSPSLKGKTLTGRIVLRNGAFTRTIKVNLKVHAFDLDAEQPAPLAAKGLGLYWQVPVWALTLEYKTPQALAQATAAPAEDFYRATRRMMAELYQIRDSGHENLQVSQQDQSDSALVRIDEDAKKIDLTRLKRLVRYLGDVGYRGTVVISATQLWTAIFDNSRDNFGPKAGLLSLRDASDQEDSVTVNDEWNADPGNSFDRFMMFFSNHPSAGYKGLCLGKCPFRLALELQDELQGIDTKEYGAPNQHRNLAVRRFQDLAYQLRAFEKRTNLRLYTFASTQHAVIAHPTYNTDNGPYRQSWNNFLKMNEADRLYFPIPEPGNQLISSRKYLDLRADLDVFRYPRYDQAVENGGHQPLVYPNWTTGAPPQGLGSVSSVFDGYLRFNPAVYAAYAVDDGHFTYAWDNYQSFISATPLWSRVYGGITHWASASQVQLLLGYYSRTHVHGSIFNDVDNDCEASYDPLAGGDPEYCDGTKDGSDGLMAAYGYGDCIGCDSALEIIPTRAWIGRRKAADDIRYLEKLGGLVADCDTTNPSCRAARIFHDGLKRFIRGERASEDFTTSGVLPVACGLQPIKNALARPFDPAKYDPNPFISDLYTGGSMAGRLIFPGKDEGMLKPPARAILRDQYLGSGALIDCVIRNAAAHIAKL